MSTANTTWVSATTYAEINEVRYKWTIRDVSFHLKDTKQELLSSCFKSSDKSTWVWYCYIMPNTDGYSKLGLRLSQCSSNPRIPSEFEFSVIGPKGEVNLAGPYYHIFEQKNNQHEILITKTEMLKYITDSEDTLTIVCRVRAMLNKQTSSDTLPIPACKMQDNLQTILKDQKFTDVTLVVEGHSIKAHKAILAARSPVFAAMFDTDMEESQQNQVTITDMEYEVAQKLLQFIYTGKTDIPSKMVDQLLVAADKYGLERLKAQCEQTILNTLTVPTAIKTLIFADRMNAVNLKSRAMKFVKTNMDKVVESADWKTMAVEHPKLLVEVCRTLARA